MKSPPLPQHLPCSIQEHLPQDAVLIIGAGHFGERAANILCKKPDSLLYIVDNSRASLEAVRELPLERIFCDGVAFLVENFSMFESSNTIIPAVPFHLAYEWLRKYLDHELKIVPVEMPRQTKLFLPFTWDAKDGSLLVSYANFRCPDDCPEPADYCTVTHKKRGTPLYQRLRELDIDGFNVYVIRSRQIAPGLGGYKVDNLKKMLTKVREKGAAKWLIGTACKCHGVLNAMEVRTKQAS